MKVGVSSWCLVKLAKAGDFTWEFAVDWAADLGADHLEIAAETAYGFGLGDKPDALTAIRDHAARRGIDISSFTFPANFVTEDEAEVPKEIERVKRQIDAANTVGAKFVRHDVARVPLEWCTLEIFDRYLPIMAEACREVADYAAQYGITTSTENHGLLVQASERVRRLILAVDRPNFRTTIDTGNFVAVDEDALSAVRHNAPYASFVHLKDFSIKRLGSPDPGEGWGRTPAGHFRRNAIYGQGDLNGKEMLRVLVESGYDGYLSIEYNGMEGYEVGCPICLANVRRYLEEIAEESR